MSDSPIILKKRKSPGIWQVFGRYVVKTYKYISNSFLESSKNVNFARCLNVSTYVHGVLAFLVSMDCRDIRY